MTDIKAKYILELSVCNTDENSHIVKDYFVDLEPSVMVVKAQECECDIIGLKFNTEDVSEAQAMLKKLLPLVKMPLMIRADAEVLSELISLLDREAIVAVAEEMTYKTLVSKVIAGGHTLVIRTPIDINLAKEMNILTTDMGLSPDKILIDPDMGGLGYGLEYGYSIMERIKLASKDDKMLSMPIIAFAGEESLKTKEAKSDTFNSSFGDFKRRAQMFEITTAAAVLAAGAEYIVLNHPTSIKTMKGLC